MPRGVPVKGSREVCSRYTSVAAVAMTAHSTHLGSIRSEYADHEAAEGGLILALTLERKVN